ncbi:DUF6443 domain-containing protein [Sphingobacterium thalpophilum]|uniref:DUF6443 domain-containing protein n=1 Tax=Sphingobacterium thalpophilum TaxID=259 RepID=UPI002D78EB5E|nr:DUF6443 domain-containing protein [Sphingobacterium thalpophilum]
MKRIFEKIIFVLVILRAGTIYGQTVDSSEIYSRAISVQPRMMASAMTLPALPSITYNIPATLRVGQTVSYLPVNSGGAVYAEGEVTLALGLSAGYVDGSASVARFNRPMGMARHSSGAIYICDVGNQRIRRYDPATDQVSTIAGSGTVGYVNGTGAAAQFTGPVDIALDASGNAYVSDRGNKVVRKITPAGVVSLFAGTPGVGGYVDGAGGSAKFGATSGLTVDAAGNVYVVDEGNLRIRKITPAGVVTTFAGSGPGYSEDGTGTAASFYGMKGIAIDGSGNLYVAEYNGCKIRKISPAGVVTTFAGSGSAGTVDGTGAAAGFYFPMAISVDPSGNVYVMQLDNRVRKITPSGIVTTIAGSGVTGSNNGSALQATFNAAEGILAIAGGDVYIGDTGNSQIRKIGKVNGYSIAPTLPGGLLFDPTTGKISGTPTVPKGLTSYTVTAYNAAGSTTSVVSFAVVTSLANIEIGSFGKNSIVTRFVRKSGYKTPTSLLGKPVDSANVSIDYFDGLGRATQNVRWQASPTKNDIVQHLEYDYNGRDSVKYLPHVKNGANNGNFNTAVKVDQLAYYSAGNTWDAAVVKTVNPYSATKFDNSPLNRITEQGAPGGAWQLTSNRSAVGITSPTGHTLVSEYGTNVAGDVRKWTINADNISADGSTYYAAKKLYKTVSKNENWIADSAKAGTIEEYIDIFENKLILKRVWVTKTKALNTYYIYDDYGNLRYVVPPGYTAPTLQETNDNDFNELVYAYKYDDRLRIVEKKTPGKGWEYFVYNKNDQLILSQDSLQRSVGKWNYTKYDAFGRIASTGIYTNTSPDQKTRTQIQSIADGILALSETRTGTAYSNMAFPNTTSQLLELTVNYYDDYSFKTTAILPATSGLDSTWMVNGLLTGTKTAKDDGSSPLLSVTYYNKFGDVVETVTDNHLGGVDRVTNSYNFVGDLVTSKRQHRINGSTDLTTLLTTSEYDHVGRLIQTKKRVNSQTEFIQSRLAYNEIGQLKTKSLHSENNGTNFMTRINYQYNERGWLTKASSSQFTTQLNYNVNGTAVLANAQYNGNIAQQLWGYATTTSNTFTYGYDAVNRLRSGVSTGTVMSEVLTYDDMGNIKTLVRDNGTTVSYGYNNANKSNRLASLSGGLTGTFVYDANGNATVDRTGMTLSYNFLNLPKTAIGGGKNISYIYDATGSKLKRTSAVGGTTTQQDYIDGIEYSRTGSASPIIERIATEDGFLLNSSGSYSYYYHLQDHLGNVRVVLKKEGTATAPIATVMQKQDYYPFGKRKSIATSIDNKYLYNGKEMQTDLNGGTHTLGSGYVLEGQYDYGARFYDAEIGRWNVVDPVADMFEDVSPYNYGMNNPILMIDPTGMAADTVISGRVRGPEVLVFRNAPKREPVKGFWAGVEQIWTGGNHNGYKYDWNGTPIGYTPVMGTPPDLGFGTAGNINAIYKGFKKGLAYIGKSFNILKRYGKAEREAMKLKSLVSGVKDPNLLRAIEQTFLEHQKTLGPVANQRNAFNPNRTDYKDYMAKAEKWLSENYPNWKDLLN